MKTFRFSSRCWNPHDGHNYDTIKRTTEGLFDDELARITQYPRKKRSKFGSRRFKQLSGHLSPTGRRFAAGSRAQGGGMSGTCQGRPHSSIPATTGSALKAHGGDDFFFDSFGLDTSIAWSFVYFCFSAACLFGGETVLESGARRPEQLSS